MDANTGGKVLAKVLAFYALLNLAIECTGLAIFLAIDPGANGNLETKVFNQTQQQSETLPLRYTYNLVFLRIMMSLIKSGERVDDDMFAQVCHEGHRVQLGAREYLRGTFSEVPNFPCRCQRARNEWQNCGWDGWCAT